MLPSCQYYFFSATLLFWIMIVVHGFSSWHGTSHFSLTSCYFLRGRNPLRWNHLQRFSRARSMWMMPEGPEVRILVDQLQPAVGMRLADVRFLSGRYVRNGPPVGFDMFRKTMTNWKNEPIEKLGGVDLVREWNAKGKFIWMVLDDGNKDALQREIENNEDGVTSSMDLFGFGDMGIGVNEDIDDVVEKDAHDSDYLRSIWITLGLSGCFLNDVHPEATSKTCRWYMEFLDTKSGKCRRVYYHDSRNFGTLKMSVSRKELQSKLLSLGPDLLVDLTEELFLNAMGRQKQELNICKFLMNQKNLSGVGNYLLSEGLYRANVDPFASIGELDFEQKHALYRELRDAAQQSYESQCGGMKGQYRNEEVDVDEGGNEKVDFELQCYGREFCIQGNPVVRDASGPHGRTIWYVEDQLFVPLHMRRGDESMPLASKNSFKNISVDETFDELTDNDSSNFQNELLTPESAVHQLKSTLTEESWIDALNEFMASTEFEDLATFIDLEHARGAKVFPPQEEIFAALNLCPADEVKVVVVGQDPYHGPGQGHGLAFSVRRGVPPPPSLKNIFKEAIADVGIQAPSHGNLECWARQGVLLLNAVLTVRSGEANSHARKGWEHFTDKVVEVLNETRAGLVFLLWGSPAARKARNVDRTRHTVIQSSHPSPLAATKTSAPFLGSRCFSRANAALEKIGEDPIDWNVL